MNETSEMVAPVTDLPVASHSLQAISPALKGFDMVPTTFKEAKEFAEFIAGSELAQLSGFVTLITPSD